MCCPADLKHPPLPSWSGWWRRALGHRRVQTHRQCQWGCCGPFSSSFSPNKSFLLWLYPPPLTELEAGAGMSHPVGSLGAEIPWQTCLQVCLSVLLCPYVPLLWTIFFFMDFEDFTFSLYPSEAFLFPSDSSFQALQKKDSQKTPLKATGFFSPHKNSSHQRTVASSHICLKSCQNNLTPASHANIYWEERESK